MKKKIEKQLLHMYVCILLFPHRHPQAYVHFVFVCKSSSSRAHTHTHTHMCSRCILSGLKSIFSLILLFNKKSAAGTPICALIFVMFFFSHQTAFIQKSVSRNGKSVCVWVCVVYFPTRHLIQSCTAVGVQWGAKYLAGCNSN